MCLLAPSEGTRGADGIEKFGTQKGVMDAEKSAAEPKKEKQGIKKKRREKKRHP